MTAEPLVCWAQDHFLHGHHLTPWITDYIDLEESLAAGSIAQEELAHASLLLELAGLDGNGRDDVVYTWDVSAWAPSTLTTRTLTEWPATVLRGLLFSIASVICTGRIAAATDPVWSGAAAVLSAEQELHVTHWTRWLQRLGTDPRTTGDLVECAPALLDDATDLFDRTQDTDVLRSAWADEVTAVFGAAGLPTTRVDPLPARARRPGGSELQAILDTVRSVRTTPDDGVLGRYR